MELLRVDPATIILGERLNFWVGLIGVVVVGAAFVYVEWLRPEDRLTAAAPGSSAEAPRSQ